ncbi:aspartate ammonia-lyase [Ornithinibacillus sp. L9]|uniref:Aspartate ammonia-lyase n=1 Tax=Ornithinibacillus caprae TaxID=2678566 RepID=A0A6N8FFM3_9BACI|nr:aspartate ammonia-lyase [Ornithinibacillus caprae]MUK88001.1 aspartate ammonia-lyase [Ornithinibacillus caprae]
MSLSENFRTEKDTLGTIKVPKDAYYGAQTQRAIENFQISNKRFPRSIIRAQGLIKASAAATNMDLEILPPTIGKAIIQAAEEVVNGKWDDQFVLDVYQAGAGTSQNMNVNEVIANRATELMDPRSGVERIHPNDHVNKNQSTNDTFHAAMQIAAIEMINEKLLPILQDLYKELDRKATEFMPIVKSGRTHLHDAVPMRLGQEFSGYAETIHSLIKQLQHSADKLYEVGLGGNAIGTKGNVHPDYHAKIIEEINRRTNLPFRQPKVIFEFMQNTGAPIRVMTTLKEISVHLIKITSDLRLLASGPRTGLAEITLPSVQPGSTIMPGKVNPAILEMTHMVCCQVIGYETAVATAGTASQLEINVMMPLIAYTLLESIDIMYHAVSTLISKCISGIQGNENICKQFMESSLALVTALSPIMGYDRASQIGKEADEKNITIKQTLEQKGLLTPEIEKALEPKGLI